MTAWAVVCSKTSKESLDAVEEYFGYLKSDARVRDIRKKIILVFDSDCKDAKLSSPDLLQMKKKVGADWVLHFNTDFQHQYSKSAWRDLMMYCN
mmetsp:Transcript_3152/g.4261  ORF Transcript_3152/g.4261 Transcript_3152/m.4261 type:complete len:94 (-) Transcript_3152:339-620(-)|eukprot:CAMPEP_0185265690 /NCGR_PEP_ID=MMETSP1359-20130426/28501_1 /TAXON_ID=552665 /ORGANISM="Bigelowiella longifila, Strain CCMP242" /LENGTH=93 /DNA_ID=CAMNT_0027855131 /DNA_START=204 /DNA_END=485 /DNA_ORIENTATION=+